MLKKIFIALAPVLLPVAAFAQANGGNQQWGNQSYVGNTDASQLYQLLTIVKRVFQFIIPLLMTLAVIFLIWAIIQMIISKDSETREEARGYLIWAVVGFAVMLGIFGLARFLLGTVGIESGSLGNDEVPCVVDADPAQAGCQ